MTTPATLTDLIRAAAHALIRRDTLEIQDLARISEGWLQSEDGEPLSAIDPRTMASDAQRLLLDAILEAACLFKGEPSELESALEDV
ncbi:hypothetical protein KY389_13275 [Paracoccus bogoriensis]|uniref:hypothetical protein n=1 Tax=Paracoccus bogoriensis TaxID=242065 RepID=UPI001CA5D902|nr:hypothetical protein [Paracoccus bogoriensis]MBW7057644.1 hypothetical protein [Paracoccus bogoriensis]